jgi:ATP-dependent DNA helicase PIF1
MKVIKMMDRVLECEVVVGTQKGLRVFLPRIPMHDRSEEFPFTIVRRQFPVRLAFCLTINKVGTVSSHTLINPTILGTGAE